MDDVCQNCHERIATVDWAGDGGVMSYVHGQYQRWCKLCALKAQLDHARERAAAIPDLVRRIAEEEHSNMADIRPNIVEGEPRCAGEDCPCYFSAAGTCAKLGSPGPDVWEQSPCVPALRQQRDDARRALAWCLEGFEGTYFEEFYKSPLFKKIERLLGADLVKQIQASAAREED